MRIYIRILIFLLVMCFALPCYAKVVLYRYTEGGEERGICYGYEENPPVDNPAWDVEIVDEKLKKHYMSKHKGELKAKDKIRKEEKKAKKDKAIQELKDLGLSDDAISAITS